MNPIDVVILLVIALIVGGASCYIYRAKKAGKGCIGCPDSATCAKYNERVSSCGGNCSYCSSCHQENNKDSEK